MVAREAISKSRAGARIEGSRSRFRSAATAAVFRASLVTRRIGLLSVPIRKGCDPDHGWGRRMGHDFGHARRREGYPSRRGDSFSTFHRVVVFHLYLFHWI